VSFDRVAGIYRVLEYAAFGRALETARFRYLDRLEQCRDILIIGEGDGRVLQRILAVAPEASVRCIDSSAAMLARAEAQVDAAVRHRVSFECADVRTAAIESSAYDAVVTMFVLDCFSPEDVGRLVERLSASLRPNGLWLFADFSIPAGGWRRLRARLWVSFLYAFFRWRTGLTVRELPPSEDILHAAGFSAVDATTLQRGLLRTAVYRARRQGHVTP
jgi:cyclopropane fatty-acyl-phospholipid synthase-like methyltransferase